MVNPAILRRLKKVSSDRYQTPDGVWSMVRIDDPQLKRDARRLPTDPLSGLHSAPYDVAELHASLPACRAA
jgi:hypothetical protein